MGSPEDTTASSQTSETCQRVGCCYSRAGYTYSCVNTFSGTFEWDVDTYLPYAV